MTGLRLLPEDGDKVMCDGKLTTLFADESSWRCTECDWSGWPRQDVELKTGVILRQYPHPFTDYQAAREKYGDNPLPYK